MPMTPQQYPLDACRLDLSRQVHAALTALIPTSDTGESAARPLSMDVQGIGMLLEQPPERQLGDYALPCFRFGKELQMKPQEIAATLAQKLSPEGWLRSSVAVGAFLNLFTSQTLLATEILPQILSGDYFLQVAKTSGNAATKVMIEYSQPNTHKEFHVGHGRNVCLGDSLVHLFRYCGYDTLGANYFGDEGTHIATVLAYILRHKLSAPQQNKGEWLGQMYVAAKKELEAAEPESKAALIKGISQVHKAIESQEGDTYRFWLETRQWSLDDFDRIYQWLRVKFEVLFYESEVSKPAQEIVQTYLDKGVFVLDQGAVGVDLKPHKLGFCILRKSDGNTLYATKDLALAKLKFNDYHISRNIYVVADEQNHHFKQVFKVLELMGFEDARKCHHLSYGMVVLPEGKMSSRDGTAVSFTSLKALMEQHLLQILSRYEKDWSPEEIAATAQLLCSGAIKYGMVATDPVKEIVFNLEDWLSFEGHSGPYLMYSYARTRSILRKAAAEGLRVQAEHTELLTHQSEHDLLRYLYDLNQVIITAAEQYKPSLLASHLFYMCKAFNRFYVDVSILKAEALELKLARIALTAAFSSSLKTGLDLLGIIPPERM